MKQNISITFSFTMLFLAYLCSCSTSVNPKKKISVEIANGSCDFVSSVTSTFLINAANSILENSTDSKSSNIDNSNSNLVPGYCCECFTYYVSKDLMESYSIEELREIKKDNIKKVIVITKLFQAHQEEIKQCIVSTTNEKIKNYADFERKLDKRIKNAKNPA